MNKNTHILAVVIALVLPAVAGAQPVKEVEVVNSSDSARFQLVGFTAATYTGDLDGVFGATRKCQNEGEGFEASRMCTATEVLDTVDIPDGLVGTAWVRPFAVGDDGGRELSLQIERFQTCNFWVSSRGNARGLAVTADGRLSVAVCYAMRSIACCALVP